MAVPSNWTRVTVQGRFLNLDGTPMTGQVTFTPTASVLLDAGASTIIAGTKWSVTLDGTGFFTVQLPATDDPDINPTSLTDVDNVLSFTYAVVEPTGRRYNLQVPSTSGTIDLVTVGVAGSGPTAPGAPTIGTATAGNTSATVTFTPPANNGGATITSYTVTSTPGGLTGTGTSSPATVSGLTNGTAYTFKVKATNSAGTGAESAASNSVTPASGATVPGAPTIGAATAGSAGSGAATVAFTAPASNGGATITSYTATSTPGGLTGTGSSSPVVVSGLTADTAYTFKVKATNSAGTGAESAASNSVSVAAGPLWVNKSSGIAARNGTTTHTVNFGFTSTAGNLLLFICHGPITNSFTGWTEQLSPVNSGEMSVATKTSTGDSSVTVTHNASDRPMTWVAYEFAGGSAWVGGDSSNSSDEVFPTLTGLSGTPVTVFAAKGRNSESSSGTDSQTTWSAPWAEDADLFAAHNGVTDGTTLTVGHQANYTTSSVTPTCTTTYTGAWPTGDRQKTTFVMTLVAPSGAPLAPLTAFTLGTEVGVPTGTSLTATSGLPTQDATVTFSRTDPITGSTISIPGVKKWSARSWAATLSGTVPTGEVWWFDRCKFTPTSNSFFCVDVDTSNGTNSRLSPTLIFTQCTFGPGAGVASDKAIAAHRVWAEDSDINQAISGRGNCEDAWIGAAYSTVIRSNIRAGVGLELTDPHSDGLQITDTGGTSFYQCWLDGGSMTGSLTGNSALRVATEFGGVDGIDVFYCGIGGRSGNNVQFRGDNGTNPSPIINVRFRGNRWCSDGATFIYDFQQESGGGTMITEWTDNKFGINCTIGGTPFTAGTVINSPGV